MSNSKDLLGFDSIFNIKNILQCLKFPLVSAAVIRENVPCLRSDGSMGQMEICKDEFGNRIDCPKYNEDVTENIEEEEEKVKKKPCRQEMAPPQYADLGKKANDVFSKGYHFGVFKLDLKTKSESGVEFTSGITSNQESGKVFGSLSSKYAVKDYGLIFTEKWNTDNTLATDITIQDKIAAGLKVTLEGTFAPQTGSKTGKLKSSFANDTVAINTNLDLDMAGPIVDVAAVLKYQGWLAGAHTQFDSQKAKFAKNNFAFGYQTNDFALHTNVDNGKDFGGSIYQKVSDKLDCGVSMKWTSGSSDTLFGVGAKFALDQDASLHAKINNKSLIGLGYQQKLRPGVTLTLSAAIDGQNFNAGGHKVGVALELEP
ncbi:voltage-dependent anion-selective channel [Danaus plexippus plexippus]|uniref:Voltage-dependent anion-selective channel n=1 Tax=Danaus plexippus plexippus TaxID=278856 RepID=A0A212ELN3_DANPL|nr:voltage-dependent anion-selective channel [Danaus plexippus plexippus]